MIDNLFFKKKDKDEFHPLDIPTRSLFASDRPLGLPIHDVVDGVTPLYTKENIDCRIHHLRNNEFTCEFSTFDSEALVEFFTADVNRQLEAFRKKVNLMSELTIRKSDNPIRGTITRRKLRKWHYKGQVFVQDTECNYIFVGIRQGDDIILCDGTRKNFNEFKSSLYYGRIKHN